MAGTLQSSELDAVNDGGTDLMYRLQDLKAAQWVVKAWDTITATQDRILPWPASERWKSTSWGVMRGRLLKVEI